VRSDGDPNPLTTLLRECVVRIDAPGHFCGTGFLVSPGCVVTCAHVVRGETELRVTWQSRPSSPVSHVTAPPPFVTVDAKGPYPPPDLAILDLDESAAGWDHPCVRLATGPPVLDGQSNVLYVAGYTDEYTTNVRELTGITTGFESEYGLGKPILYKIKEGQVRPGYSGSPLLDLRTGAVTGITKASRDRNDALGGYAVPATELTVFRDVIDANLEFHCTDSRWKIALERHLIRPLNRRMLGLYPAKPIAPAIGDEKSPHTLFSPRYAIVGYVGRTKLLADVADWREDRVTDAGPVGLRLVMAPGGCGKTRLAVEACAQAESVGWTAGILRPDVTNDQIRDLAEWPGRLLLVVDNADSQPRMVEHLVGEFVNRAPRTPVRIMLLVRGHTEDKNVLTKFNENRNEDLRAVLFSAQVFHLDDDSTEVDRLELFRRACADFARYTSIELQGDGSPLPSLHDPHFARPLYVLMAAYLHLNRRHKGSNVDSLGETGLLHFSFEQYEAQYWRYIARRRELAIDTTDQWNAVAVATLLTAEGDTEALALVRLIPNLGGATEQGLIAVARWLGELYAEPAAADRELRIASLEPDNLGEFLVAGLLNRYPDLLAAAMDVASDRQLAHALTIVTNAAVANPAVMRQLSQALDERFTDLFLRGLGAGLQHSRADPELFNAVVVAMLVSEPIEGTIAFAKTLNLALPRWLQEHCIAAADIAATGLRELVRHYPAREPELILILSRLSVRLRMSGKWEESAEHAREAVRRCRALVADHPGEFQSILAFALLSLVEAQRKFGRGAETRALADETVAVCRTLVATDQTDGPPYLAAALRNLGWARSDDPQHETALGAAGDAVSIDRALSAGDPLDYLPDLAQSLVALALAYESSGQSSFAEDAAKEAVEIFRRVAGNRGDAYLPELAEGLVILAKAMLDTEPPDQALRVGYEAVTIFRDLIAADEDDVLRGDLAALAGSLRVVAAMADRAGKMEEALAAWEEATDVYRRLARANPGGYQPGLAAALTGLGVALWDVGQLEDGLSATREAVSLNHSIAEANPDEYRVARAQSLTNLAAYLAHLDLDGEALPIAREAVREYRQLAESGADVTSALATALTNLAALLGEVGNTAEAIRMVTETASLYADRTDPIPIADLPSFAASLLRLAGLRKDDGRPDEAVDRARQAVDLQRLAAEHIPREVPALAEGLGVLADCLESAGRAGEPLAPMLEAVGIYRKLAIATPKSHARSLGDAVESLATLLDGAGRHQDADELFAEYLGLFAEAPAGLGPILLARGGLQASRSDLPAAIADLDASTRAAIDAEDYATRGRARRHLCALRAADSPAFDRAWGEQHSLLPVWLRDLSDDNRLTDHMITWVGVTAPRESRSYLEDHADLLLTEHAEAALEHFIDANPAGGILRSRLKILHAARTQGIGNAYCALTEYVEEREAADLLYAWLSGGSWEVCLDFAVEHAETLVAPALVAHFDWVCDQHLDWLTYRLHRGVLHYAAQAPDPAGGFRDGYDLGTDAGRLRFALTASDPPLSASVRLAIARMYSGQYSDQPEAHFLLAGILLGEQEPSSERLAEARVVLADCAANAAPYERRDFTRRLREFVAEHPALAQSEEEFQRSLIEPS
jgi:hypothetical protein